MRTKIKPSALYWASFNRFELRIPGQCAIDCSHSGQCDSDVAFWVPRVRAQMETDNFPNKPTEEKIREELKESGAWSDEELQDVDQNWARLVWIAACNVSEDESPAHSAPVKPLRTLTPGETAERAQLRERLDAFERWRNGRTSYPSNSVPQQLEISNEARSRLEILDFIADPPSKYFAYVKDGSQPWIVSTWTGDTLATVIWQGTPFVLRAFGGRSERVNFRCVGINGATYSGTYYKSSGNYCRLRRSKG